MRFIDFMVFYPMENFKRKKLGGDQLGRAVFLASLNVSFIIVIIVEIFFYLLRVDIASGTNFFLKFAIGAMVNTLLFRYIYIKKKRYEYITSRQYKPFETGIKLGVAITFLIFIACLIGTIGIPVAISKLLAK